MKNQEHQHHHNYQENFPRRDRDREDRRKDFKPDSSKRVGQFFGLIYNLALLYVIYDLAKSGNIELAFGIFSLNIALIIFAIIFTKRAFKPRNNNSGRGFRPRPYNRDRDHSSNRNS